MPRPRKKTRSVRDKTGDFCKIRVWNPNSLTWVQEAATFNEPDRAIEAAKKKATPSQRVQAIRLQGRSVHKMKMEVLYDSQPKK